MTHTASPSLPRIWQAIACIPRGRVASYSQVAEVAGLPGRARLVGYALKVAPKTLALPWHRVLTAQGKSAFPKNSHLWQAQWQRLDAEGVTANNGRVDLRHYGWRAVNLDELLWKPDDQ